MENINMQNTLHTCTICQQAKPLTKFEYRKDRGKHRNQCRKCRSQTESAKRLKKISKQTESAKLSKRLNRQKNRSRNIKVGGNGLTVNELKNIYKNQEGKCVYCKKQIQHGVGENSYHLDHIIPIAFGGQNTVTNIQLLCPTCNIRKGNINPVMFVQIFNNLK